jgi:hypothetical protein
VRLEGDAAGEAGLLRRGGETGAVETIQTDNAIAAPTPEFTTTEYTNGGTLSSHVASQGRRQQHGHLLRPALVQAALKIAVAQRSTTAGTH